MSVPYRGFLKRWIPRGLIILTVYLVFNSIRFQRIDDVTDVLKSHLSPRDQRLLPRMLFVDSRLNNLTCGSLSSQLISQSTELDVLKKLLKPLNSIGRFSQRNLTKDCSTWRAEHFHRWPVTVQEMRFPLAFSFKVHRDPEMFERLLSVLWRPQNFYCVHVDIKTSAEVYQRIADLADCFENVVLTKTRIDVIYASIASLAADLECIKLAFNSAVRWKYHINLCGQEFPLKTNLEMVQILTVLNGSNDVENYPPSAAFADLSYKHKAVIVKGFNSFTNITKNPFQHSTVEIRKGSAYNCLTRPFLQWALNDKINLDFLNWLNDTWAPDELFWATLSYRKEAPGGPGVVIRHDTNTVLSKAVIWTWDPHKCLGYFIRSSCIFGALDLPWLLKRHELIANKFDQERDSLVLDCLEWELERRALSGYREAGQASADGHWPLVSSLNWTHYRLLPQFARA